MHNRFLRSLILLMTLALLLVTAIRSYLCWKFDFCLNHPSGVWVALAVDLKDGIFYRPLFSDYGYGGTRYFPLHFVLHAGLLRLGLDPRHSGYALDALVVVLLLAGLCGLLRKLGLDPTLAGCCAILVLAARSGQLALLGIRGDGLAAALNILAVGVCSGTELSRRRIFLAAGLFTLAWAAKVTMVFGLVAVFLFLLASGRSKLAWWLAGLTATGYAIVMGVMYLATGTRFFDIMQASALANVPWYLVFRRGPPRLLVVLTTQDPGSLAFFVMGLAAFLALPWKAKLELPGALFLATAGLTAVMMGSGGYSGANHLVDLHVAAVIVFCAWLLREEGRNSEFGVAALAAATLVALVPLSWTMREEYRLPRESCFDAVRSVIGNTGRPILAENPILPILAGERPYVLDPFYVQALRRRFPPSFANPLWQRLRERSFGAVVLIHDPRTPEDREWYREIHFGEGFVQELEDNYELVAQVGGCNIYRPGTRRSAVLPIAPVNYVHRRYSSRLPR